MMNKKVRVMILILGIFTICLMGGILAINASSISALSISKIGIIDIELSTYTINDNNIEVKLEDNYNISSDILSYISKVENEKNSGDCYIRLKVTLNQEENEKMLVEEDIENLNSDFVYSNDGYFYYKKILKNQETVTAFDGIKLSEDVLSSETLEVKVEAEAIQAKNFTPDFTNLTTEGPWKGITSKDIKKAQSSTNFN